MQSANQTISGLATMQYYKTHGEPAWQHGPAAKSPQNGQGLIVIGDYLGLPYLIYWPIRRLDHIARYLLHKCKTRRKVCR